MNTPNQPPNDPQARNPGPAHQDPGRAALAAELRDLGERLRTPPAPDFVAAVRARLATEPAPAARSGARRRRRWTAFVAAVAAAGALAVTPQARAAVGHVLRFAGIEFGTGAPPRPAVSQPPPPSESVSLAEARRRAGFAIGTPAALAPPDEVQVLDVADGRPRVVSLLWRTTPAAVGVRLDEYDGQLDPYLYKRIGAPDAESVQLGDGVQGLWIPTPHEVTYIDRTGATRTAQSRTAGPTLVWQTGAVMYRLEGNLTRDQATAIAASVRP